MPLEIYYNVKTWKQIVIFFVKHSDINFHAYTKLLRLSEMGFKLSTLRPLENHSHAIPSEIEMQFCD